MKQKPAYLIRSGAMYSAANVSNKLHSHKATRRAIKAARRMGFTDAYAVKVMVHSECVLK